MFLAGDIGGTHTRLALFERGKKVSEKKYLSGAYQGLEEVVQGFLREEKQEIKTACFGIAGPVRNGICKATNLPWIVDAASLRRILQIPVRLLNDLEANAYGLRRLKQEELYLLHKGISGQVGNQALIAAGTGLGEAGLFWDGKEHKPFACEGGHTDFAPRSIDEIGLLQFLSKKLGHVSYERIVSGPGLLTIFQFLVESGRIIPSKQLKEEMERKDPSQVISNWGNQGIDIACTLSLEWFVSLYGAEAGNLALKFLSLGGVYIGGGIAPHILETLKKGLFVSAFVDKGRFQGLLESIPIWVVLNDDAALLGAAWVAENL
ncbi:MAG: glucokinase [Chlamydiia bacterium]|nr:glucokinase [Chlamydiia bacterium]